MSFDAPAAAVPEPAKPKLSRLKRAAHVSVPNTAAQHQLPAVSEASPQALVDRTNTNIAREQVSLRPLELPPARGSSAAANSAASSPSQPSANRSAAPSRQPANASSETPDSEQAVQVEAVEEHAVQAPKSPPDNDYWDSEDELEAELTRRERAEGFHANSATSSEGKAAAEDSESDADSYAKKGSHDNYDELNSQTQRVLRDGAKLDTIGQGQAIQRQALTGVLGKILSRKDAVAMRAPAIPVLSAKQDRQVKVSPKALAARLHEQAGQLMAKAAAPEEEDILVLSGDESDQDGPDDAAVLAGASLALKQAKQTVAQHKSQPPHQNRLGLPVGASGRAPEDDTQEMGFDSIPFEEPELFAARNEPEAKGWLADKQNNSLHLRLDSQDDLGNSLAEDEGVSAQLSKEDCTKLEAEKLSGAGQEHVLEHSEDTPGHSDDVVSAGRAHASDEEGHELNSSEASSGSASSSGCREDAQNSAAEEDLDKQDAESSDMKQEAECSPSEAHLQDVNPEGTEWWKKARQKQAKTKEQVPLYNEFVDEEAEMSEDEGHSLGGSDDDADEGGDLEDLIGQEKENKGDEARRARLHQQWLEQQDAQQVAQLLQGVRNGFRRKRAGDLLDEDVGNDWDARRRRARRESDDGSILSEEEEDMLAGLMHLGEDDNEDLELTEQAKQQLRNATAVKSADNDGDGSIDLDAGSQEILALLSATSQSMNSQGRHNSKLPVLLAGLPGSHTAPATQKATFMGRSVPALAAARGASQMASRSYVFGRDDSNSAAAPTDGSGAQVSGPTSFSGLDSIIKEGSSQAAGAASLKQAGTKASKKSSLLRRLAGKGSRLGDAAGKVSAADLQNALASSFGVHSAARAHNALRK